MKLRSVLVAFALTAAATAAAAQTVIPGTVERPADTSTAATPTGPSQVQLSTAQKTAIIDAIRQEGKHAQAGTEFVAAIGGSVPPQLELYLLPDRVLATVPAAKAVKYTLIQNQIVLVDPTTMRIVDIIPE